MSEKKVKINRTLDNTDILFIGVNTKKFKIDINLPKTFNSLINCLYSLFSFIVKIKYNKENRVCLVNLLKNFIKQLEE
jgi:hypothetical protein